MIGGDYFNKSLRMIHKTLAILKHSFNIAKNLDYFPGDKPLLKVQMPRVNNKSIRFLSKQEAQQLLALSKDADKTLYEMCVLSLYCRLRIARYTLDFRKKTNLNFGLSETINYNRITN